MRIRQINRVVLKSDVPPIAHRYVSVFTHGSTTFFGVNIFAVTAMPDCMLPLPISSHPRILRLFDGQPHAKRRALADRALHLDAPMVLLDDAVCE